MSFLRGTQVPGGGYARSGVPQDGVPHWPGQNGYLHPGQDGVYGVPPPQPRFKIGVPPSQDRMGCPLGRSGWGTPPPNPPGQVTLGQVMLRAVRLWQFLAGGLSCFFASSPNLTNSTLFFFTKIDLLIMRPHDVCFWAVMILTLCEHVAVVASEPRQTLTVVEVFILHGAGPSMRAGARGTWRCREAKVIQSQSFLCLCVCVCLFVLAAVFSTASAAYFT